MDIATDTHPCQYVVIRRNGMDGKMMQLERNSESVFGSDVDCDVRIRHNLVAPQHARVVVDENGQVSVLSLVNGAPVALNNRSVEKQSLIKDNDILTVGDRQFRFQCHRKVLSPVNRRTSKSQEGTPKTPFVHRDTSHADVSVCGQENNPVVSENVQHSIVPPRPTKELAKSPSRSCPAKATYSPSRKSMSASVSRRSASTPIREATLSPSRRSAPSPYKGNTPTPLKSTPSLSREPTQSPSRRSCSATFPSWESAQSPSKNSTLSPSRRPAPSLSPSRESVSSPSKRSPAPSPSRRSPAPSPSRRSPAPSPSRMSPAPSPSRRSPAPSPSRRSPAPSPSKRSPAPSPSRRSPAPSPSRRSPAPSPLLAAPSCETRDVTALKEDLPFVQLAQTSGSGGSCPSTPEMKTITRKRTTPRTAPAKVSRPAKRTASPKSLSWVSFGFVDSPDNMLGANCSIGEGSPAVVHSPENLGTHESLVIQQEVIPAAKIATRASRRVSSPFPHGLRSSNFLPTVKSTPNSSRLGSRQQTPIPSSVGESFRSRRSSCTTSASLLGSIQEVWESPASPAAKTPNNALFQDSLCARTQSTKRKSVTFGPQLSPEVFHSGLPPNTPLQRGTNPNGQNGLQGVSRISLTRNSIGVHGESLGIVEEEETTDDDSQYVIEEESTNCSTLAHCPSPPAINLSLSDRQEEEEGEEEEVYYESDFEDDSEFMEEETVSEGATPKARQALPTPVRRDIEAQPALRKTRNAMPTPLRDAIKQRPKLRSRRNRMPTPLRRAIEDKPSLRRLLRRMQTPLRREIESKPGLRKTMRRLPTPLRKEIEKKPQLRATKRSMPTPVRREIVSGVQLKQARVQKSLPTPLRKQIASRVKLEKTRRAAPTPLRKQIESGVELRKTRKAAPTPLRKQIESGVELRKTRKAASTPLRKQIESGVELRKTRKAAPTPLRKQIESGVELRKTRKAAPTPLRKQIESGVELRKTRRAAPTPLRKQIESGVELRKTRRAAPTPLRKEIESGVELRKTKRTLPTPLKLAIQQGKQLKKTKKSLPTSVKAEIEAQPQLRKTKRSIPADLKMAIESQPVLKKVQLPEASKKSVQGRKRRVSSGAEDISTAKRRRVAQSHQKNTVVNDDSELDGLQVLFATPKPTIRPFDPSTIVLTPGVFGRVQFNSPVSRTAQKKTPSGVAAPKILKAVPLMEMPSNEVFVFTAKPVRATRESRKKKADESAKTSRKSSKPRAKSARGAAKAKPQEEIQTGRQTRSGKRAPDSGSTVPVKKPRVAQEPVAALPAVRRSMRHAKTVVSKPVTKETVDNEPVAEQTVVSKPVAEQTVVNKPVAEQTVVNKPVAEETTCSTRRKAAKVSTPEDVQQTCDLTVRRSTRGKAHTASDTPLELPTTRQTRRGKKSAVHEVKQATTDTPTVTPTVTPPELPATKQTRSQRLVTEVSTANVVAASTRSTRQRKAAVGPMSEEAQPPAKKRATRKYSPEEEQKTPPRAKRGASTKTTDAPLVRRSARLAKK